MSRNSIGTPYISMESMKTSRSVVVLNGKGSLDCLANGHIIQGTAKVVDALLKQPSFLRV